MTLKIISAEDILFEGDVTMVRLPGGSGEFTVLKNHAALVSTLTRGNVVYTRQEDGATEQRAIDGGIVKVEDNMVAVCIC